MVKLLKSNPGLNSVYEFSVAAAAGSTVCLAGSFNEWNPDASRMLPAKNGRFAVRVQLRPGEYEYKFVINDEWFMDRENEEFSANDLGTLNSVLKVD